MNRERKLRAWDGEEMIFILDLYWFEENGVRDFQGVGHYRKFEIMQSTGLKDKNGKEIYEGDLVRVFHDRGEDRSYTTVGVVEYHPAEFYINGDGHHITNHFHYNDSDREVIGNIYENPELWEN